MQKGKNNVHIACTLEVINTLREFSSAIDQNEGWHLIKRLLINDEGFKKRFIEKYGEAVYQETLKHYSKTNIEQRAERKLKEEQQRIKEEARQKIEQLKAEAYATQSNLGKQKFDSVTQDAIADVDLQIAKYEKQLNDNPNASGSFKHEVREILERLRKQKQELETPNPS